MKIKVDESTINMVKYHVHKMLMLGTKAFGIHSFKYVEEEVTTKATIFRKAKTKKEFYITELVILGIHQPSNTMGEMTDTGVEHFVRLYDLYKLRQNWKDMLAQFEAFEFKVTKNEKPKEAEKPQMVIDDSGSMKPTIPDVKES